MSSQTMGGRGACWFCSVDMMNPIRPFKKATKKPGNNGLGAGLRARYGSSEFMRGMRRWR